MKSIMPDRRCLFFTLWYNLTLRFQKHLFYLLFVPKTEEIDVTNFPFHPTLNSFAFHFFYSPTFTAYEKIL